MERSEPKFQIGDTVKWCGANGKDKAPLYWIEDIVWVNGFQTYVLVRLHDKVRVNIGGPRTPGIDNFRVVDDART